MPKLIKNAKENIKNRGLCELISVRVGDGLNPIGEAETEGIIIAGMGGKLMEKIISEVNSMAERDVYIHSVAKTFDVQIQSIRSDVDRIISMRERSYKKSQAQKIKQETAGYSDRINPDYLKAPAVAKNEETVLGLLLLYPDHRKFVFTKDLLSENDFYTELNKRIFVYLKRAYNESDDNLISLNDEFTQEEIGRMSRMKVRRMELTSNGEDVLLECIDNLKKSVDKKTSENNVSMEDLQQIIFKKRSN